jgi:uncharacterized protein (TIGR03437 family)
MRQMILALLVSSSGLWGQALSSATLNGKYWVHQFVRTMSSGTQVDDQRSLTGTLQFNGAGAYTFTGTRKAGAGAAEAFTSSGTYTMSAIGVMSLTNLQGTGANVNARYAPLAIIGASTEASGVYDLFVAVPAPSGFAVPTLWDGVYRAGGVEFESAASRAMYFTASLGAATVSSPGATGISTSMPVGLQTSPIPTTPLAMNTEGRGQASFFGSGPISLYFGAKSVWGSADGNVLLMTPDAPGTHGLTVAVRALPSATNGTYSGLYWSAGMRHNGARPGSFTGSVKATGIGVALIARRARELEGVTDFTGRADYQIGPDGTGTNLRERLLMGAGGNAFVGSGASTDDLNNYELYFGVRAPTLTAGPAPYLDPYAAVNTASFAPPTNPAAPGQYVDLYGSGLAGASMTATAPFPKTLGGVQVLLNEQPVPIYLITPTVVKILIPQATAPGVAAVKLVVDGKPSNTISLPITATAPGVFSAFQNGIGAGAILRENYSLMTALNPARRGETIQVFLTGLGAVTNPPVDGAVAPSAPFSRVLAGVKAYIRGVEAAVTFQGLAPGLVSLNQMNIVVPPNIPGGTWALAIETSEGFTDQVDVVVAP